MKTTITPWGNSLAVRIPKPFAVQAGMLSGVEITIMLKGNQIILEKQKTSLHDLIEGITPENLHSETDTGAPVGHEYW